MNEEATVRRIAGMVGELAGLSSQVADDRVRLDVIAALEKLKAAAAAAQQSLVADLVSSHEAANRAFDVEAQEGRGRLEPADDDNPC